MCMLSVITPDAEINYEHLLNGARQNTDGYGFAMVTHKGEGGLIVCKSMNRWEVIDKLRAARLEHPGTYAMFHSRWSTGGARDVTNCHPFQVGSDPLTVLAHNGVFAGLSPTDPADHRSDTAVFAEEIMPKRYRRLDRAGVQQQLMSAIGTYNKVGILTANPRYLDDAYLFNQPAGTWVEGVWHSNSDYKREAWASRYHRTSYLDADTWDDGDWTAYRSPTSGTTYRWRKSVVPQCPICEADLTETLDVNTGECVDCGFCVDCHTWMQDCSCTTAFDPKRFLPVTTARASSDDAIATARAAAAARASAAAASAQARDSGREQLALPAGSGSATRYGDGFDGTDAVLHEPENYDDCEFHPVTNFCMSRACPFVHKLPDTAVERILADFDAALEPADDTPVVMGPTSMVLTPAGDAPSVYVT